MGRTSPVATDRVEGVEAELDEVAEPEQLVGKDELDEDDEMVVDGDQLVEDEAPA